MKIGSQAQRSSAISASNAETIVVRGRDLCGELVGVDQLHRSRLAADHRPAAGRGATPRAGRHAGGHRRARTRAERGREPHDAGRGARGAAGRGGGGNSRLRLGDPRRRRRRGAAVRAILARAAGESPEAAARAVLGELRAARQPVPGYGHPAAQAPGSARGAAAGGGHRGGHRRAAHRDRRRWSSAWCPRSGASRWR